jgi:hypothetical protein
MVKMHFNLIGFEGVNWIHLAQDRVHWGAVMNMVMSLWILLKEDNFFLMLSDISDISRKTVPWS